MLETVIWEWVSLLARWVHAITAIAWIGSSFYFIHLDLSLRRRDGLAEGVGGEAWQVHGGGFYRMSKYLVAPAELPKELTWFKWEAYSTWISGFFLLVIVYYGGSELYLIDPAVLELPAWGAVLLSLVALAGAWLGYEALCRSPLGRDETVLAVLGFIGLVAIAYGMTRVFSGRGAFVQMGALIGTMMVANVFVVIIPNQKKTVAAMLAGRKPDPALGLQAKQRSTHNNYLTLPVVFLMLSNHYPLAFASRWNWAIVGIVIVIGGVVRHFYNERHAGRPTPWWTWGVAAIGMLAVVWLSAQGPATVAKAEILPPADFAAVQEIVTTRCGMCHAAEPVWAGVGVPPKGVKLDTPHLIHLHAREIALQAVMTHAMPPGNITAVTPEERRVLAAWVAAGAPVQ